MGPRCAKISATRNSAKALRKNAKLGASAEETHRMSDFHGGRSTWKLHPRRGSTSVSFFGPARSSANVDRTAAIFRRSRRHMCTFFASIGSTARVARRSDGLASP